MSQHEDAVRGAGLMLRAYMGYSRSAGPGEGALLVFAHNSREARRLAAPEIASWFDGDYLDPAVRWLREPDVFRHGDAAKLAAGMPHVIDCPEHCRDCHNWFAAAYDENGRCESCAEAHADWLNDAPTPEQPALQGPTEES